MWNRGSAGTLSGQCAKGAFLAEVEIGCRLSVVEFPRSAVNQLSQLLPDFRGETIFGACNR